MEFGKDANGAFIQYTDNEGVLIKVLWVRNLKDIPTLAHEILHLVFNVLTEKGLEYNLGSEESYTYLMGFIMDQILNDRGQPVNIKF